MIREIYRSRTYHPDQIATIYAKVDYDMVYWRIEEVNDAKRTIREYVTDDASMFTQDQIDTMQEHYRTRVYPSWTLIRS